MIVHSFGFTPFDIDSETRVASLEQVGSENVIGARLKMKNLPIDAQDINTSWMDQGENVEGGEGSFTKRRLKVSRAMLRRVFKLIFFEWPDRQLLCWWIVAVAGVVAYCWCSYNLVFEAAKFSTLLYDYSEVDTNETQAVHVAFVNFKDDFYKVTLNVSVISAVTAIIYSGFISASHRIAERNRSLVSASISKKLMSGNVFYVVSSTNRSLDNLDARFTHDLQQFGWHACNCIFGNIYYTGILPTIGLAMCYTWLMVQTAGYQGVVIGYTTFAFFVVTNFTLSNWVAKFRYTADIHANNLREAHAHLQKHAETVAFYRGGAHEKMRLQHLFNVANTTSCQYYNRFFFLNLATNWYYRINTIVNFALPGLLLFWQQGDKDATPDDILNLVVVTAYNSSLQSTLTYSIYCSEAFSHAISHGTRVCEALQFLSNCSDAIEQMSAHSRFHTSDHLAMEDVTCVTPLKTILLSNLSFSCAPDDRLLIQGPSGSGKSSLLRVLCGLWPAGRGTVNSINSNTFFMPQKPYLAIGSLRSQFSYPSRSELHDHELEPLLRKVRLDYLLSRFDSDAVEDWANVLSVGEQQRIGMARLLHHRPSFAVLDECTSAVDGAMEESFYQQLVDLNVVFVSVAHRASVLRYHTCSLHLNGKGGYEFVRFGVDEL